MLPRWHNQHAALEELHVPQMPQKLREPQVASEVYSHIGAVGPGQNPREPWGRCCWAGSGALGEVLHLSLSRGCQWVGLHTGGWGSSITLWNLCDF